MHTVYMDYGHLTSIFFYYLIFITVDVFGLALKCHVNYSSLHFTLLLIFSLHHSLLLHFEFSS